MLCGSWQLYKSISDQRISWTQKILLVLSTGIVCSGGICIALLPTAFSFVLVSNIFNQLKTVLTNVQVIFIGGVTLWGTAVSLLTIGPFLEKIGFLRKFAIAELAHLECREVDVAWALE